MNQPARAPNRLLDLGDLHTEPFSSVLEQMDALLEREDVSYLHPGKRWEYPWALERAALAPGSRVLDAGSGDSIFPVYLAKQGHQVTAADLEFTGTLGDLHDVPLTYVKGDLTALPFPGAHFDVVFCISVIEHLPEAAATSALQEMHRVTRRGGKLLLTTDYYEDAEAEIWYRGPGREPFPVDWKVFDEERLRRLILEAPGWRVEGEIDLEVDWDETRPKMRSFHGYPYTSVGVALIRL